VSNKWVCGVPRVVEVEGGGGIASEASDTDTDGDLNQERSGRGGGGVGGCGGHISDCASFAERPLGRDRTIEPIAAPHDPPRSGGSR